MSLTVVKMENSPTTDVSSLQLPIFLRQPDAMQIWHALNTGTEEIRNALIRECQIIMECKVCKSLFRGLPNFLAHKRIYCTQSSDKEPLVLGDLNTELDIVLVEPTDPDTDKQPPKPSQFYEDVMARIDDNLLLKSEARVQLQRIDGNKNAVFQEMVSVNSRSDKDNDNFTVDPNVVILEPKPADGPLFIELRKKEPYSKTESVVSAKKSRDTIPTTKAIKQKAGSDTIATKTVKPNMGSDTIATTKAIKQKVNSDTIVTTKEMKPKSGSDARLPSPKLTSRNIHEMYKKTLSRFRYCDVKSLKCKKCDIRYQSFKSLKRHMFNKHLDMSKKIPCPKCGTNFRRGWNISRHLRQVHKMSLQELSDYHAKQSEKLTPVDLTILNNSQHCSDDKKEDNKKGTIRKSAETKSETLMLNDSISGGDKPGKLHANAPSTTMAVIPLIDIMDRAQNGTSGKIEFTKGFTLLKCSCCNKVFGKKEAYVRHVTNCDDEISFKNLLKKTTLSNASNISKCTSLCNNSDSKNIKPSVSKPGEKTTKEKPKLADKSNESKATVIRDTKDIKDGTAPSLQGSMEKFELHLYNLRFCNQQKLSDERICQLNKILDESNLKCLQCGMKFPNNSGLHRHAVRHMGWKRFKCKLCSYMAFNRSDVKTHLKRVHPAKTAGMTDLNKFMVNLDEEGSKLKSSRSRLETKVIGNDPKPTEAVSLKNRNNSQSPLRRKGLRETSGSRDRSTSSNISMKRTSLHGCTTSLNDDLIKSDYNISTRRIARTFDLRPCRRSDILPTVSDQKSIGSPGSQEKKRTVPGSETNCAKPSKMIRLE